MARPRPRRLRRTSAHRRMLAETTLRPEQLVLPLFVNESLSEPRGIPSMPGVHQHTLTSLRPAVEEANAAGNTLSLHDALPISRKSVV